VTLANKREVKAIQFLAKGNNIKPVNQSKFLVRSQSNPLNWHKVTWKRNQWCCDCEDYLKRRARCKHVYAVFYFQALREITSNVKDLENGFICRKCNSDKFLVKYGFRHNQSGPVQKVYCRRCKKWSTNRGGFEKMRTQTLAILSALDLYFRNVSLREIAQHLKSTFGVDVTYGTVYNWIRKYVELVYDYTRGLKGITMGRWLADETLIRVRGRHAVMWSLLDSETRCLIAWHISRKRSEEEAATLFRKGKMSTRNLPTDIVTDGLPSYCGAIEAEFSGTNGMHGSEQVLHVLGPLVGKINNNKVERFQGSVKSRLKAMGHLNSLKGARNFAKGYHIHYNFIREHKALNGRTPAEVAGISEEKQNWQKLIRKASLSQRNLTLAPDSSLSTKLLK
jgi:transposase-like protein